LKKIKHKHTENKKSEHKDKKKKTVTWIYSQHHSGDFWFVDVEWVEKGYFVHFRNRHTALDWDTIEAAISLFRGKEEAKIINVVERSKATFSWIFFANKNKNKHWKSFGFVRLNTSNITKDVFIPAKHTKEAKDQDMVTIQVTEWTEKNPAWKVVEVIWNAKKRGTLLESLIAESWFRREYPEWVLKKLERIDSEITSEEFTKRKDLRNLLTFTIDGEDAKDLDDAISLEYVTNQNPPSNLTPNPNTSLDLTPNLSPQGEGGNKDFYKLYVHIADVTHFVKEGSDLDKLALKKATSVYLADRVIPMLPTKLSNDLCSLNNESEKLSLTCEMHVGKSGSIFHTEIYESVIKSDYRFTYKEIDELLAWKIDETSDLFGGWKLTKNVIKILEQADILKNILMKYKSGKWMLEFDFPETRVLVEDYEVQKIYEYPKYESNEMIEQFMVLANESVAFQFQKYPFLYRVHEKPKEESVQKLEKALENFWIEYTFYNATPPEFLELLRVIKDHPKAKAIEKLILRTLTKAEYKEKNLWHFWLASKYYSHFTSPIRRYPDLQIHRIIKQKIAGKLNKDKIVQYKETLPEVAKQSSEQERKAEKLEYRVRDYYICQYYSSKVWQQFEGKISGMIPAWIFIELLDSAEGFVELDKFVYTYNEETLSVYNKITDAELSLWDDLTVQLTWVDQQRFRLNFEIV
jgi:ribonuclease R